MVALGILLRGSLGKIGFVPQAGYDPSRLVRPETAVRCLMDVKPVDSMTSQERVRESSPLIPTPVGGTKVALYAVVTTAIPVITQASAEPRLREFG